MDENDKHDKTVSPQVFLTTSTSRLGKPSNTAQPGLKSPNSSSLSVDTSVDEDEINTIPRPSTPVPGRSPVHFVLGNFLLAISSISFTIFTIFFTVIWFTVLQDARSVSHRDFSNVTGVSPCSYRNNLAFLMTVVVAGVDTRSQPPTGPRYMCIIHFVGGRHLRCVRHFWGSVLGRCSRPRTLRAVRQGTQRIPQRVSPSSPVSTGHLPMNSSPSNPVFSFVPYISPISKRLRYVTRMILTVRPHHTDASHVQHLGPAQVHHATQIRQARRVGPH